MKKHLFPLFLSTALLVSLFAGCGGAPSTSAESAQPSASAEVSKAAETSAPTAAVSAEEASVSSAEDSAAEELNLPPLSVTLPLDQTGTITIWDVFPPPLVGYMEGPWDCAANTLLEEATNVHLAYTTVSTEVASEQFNLMVASGVFCDLIYGVGDYYSAGPDAAITDDIILDVSDMAATMPNYQSLLQKYPDAEEHTTGGRMYRFPMIVTEPFNDTVQGMSTRGDWMKALGLSAPKTPDEFADLLKAYKNAYGGGTYLMDSTGFAASIGNGFGVANDFYQVDGQVKYGPMEDGFQDYIEFAHQLYADGLLCPDFYSLSGPPTDLISNGTVGVWTCDVGMWSMFTSGIDTEGYETVGFASPVTTAGEKTHFAQEQSVAKEGMSIGSSCQQLDLMAAYIDYLYSDDFALIANYGKEGEGFNYDADGNPHLSDSVLHSTETITSFAVKKYTLFSLLPHQDIQTRFKDAYDDNQLSTIALWTDSSDSAYTFPTGFALTEADSSAVAALMSDIETSVDEYMLGFITGSISMDQYSAFLQGMRDMGIQDALDIYQSAFDQYQSAET